MLTPALRTVYPTFEEAVRQIATFFNVHRHAPYSKTTSVSVSTTLDDSSHTVSVSVSGLTITLPAARSDRIGEDWTVHLGAVGNVTIQRAGSDTICTPYSSTDTSVQIITLGESITFRCLTTTTWGIV